MINYELLRFALKCDILKKKIILRVAVYMSVLPKKMYFILFLSFLFSSYAMW